MEATVSIKALVITILVSYLISQAAFFVLLYLRTRSSDIVHKKLDRMNKTYCMNEKGLTKLELALWRMALVSQLAMALLGTIYLLLFLFNIAIT